MSLRRSSRRPSGDRERRLGIRKLERGSGPKIPKVLHLLLIGCATMILRGPSFVGADPHVRGMAYPAHPVPPGDGSGNASSSPGPGWKPSEPLARPHYDVVVAALVRGGDSQEALDEIALVRRIYARYEGDRVVVPSAELASGEDTVLSMKLIFVVGRAGLPEDVEVPDEGLLLGDFYHVTIQEGYTHLSEKTRALMALHDHVRFRFLVKVDGDTFPCLSLMASKLLEVPLERQPLLYAGAYARTSKVWSEGPWSDPEFVKVSGGVMEYYPGYNLGACYVLGEQIVHYLNRNRHMLQLFAVEDAMVGVWLLGVKHVQLVLDGSLHCHCHSQKNWRLHMAFSHHCDVDQMNKCFTHLDAC